MYRIAILALIFMSMTAVVRAECDGVGCEAATELYEELDNNIVVDIVDDSGDDSTPSMDEVMEEEAPTFEDDDVIN